MKNLIILFICIIASHIAIGQGVGVGTTSPEASAKLDVSSTTQGMLVPRMTTAQRTSITSPATGLLVFDITTSSFWFKGSSSWIQLVDSVHTEVHRNGTNKIYFGLTDNVGIGTSTPNAPLQFASVEANRKIVLYESANNDHHYFGFGVNSSALRYQALGDHVFFTGNVDVSSKELMRIKGTGNVGIGVISPLATLEIARGTGNNGTLMIKGTTQASHFNFSTDEHTYIRGGKANSNVLINDVGGLGNVGIGTALPIQKLHVEGNTYISQKLGIGTNLPNAPLQFNNDPVNRKIVLYEGTPNDHQYYGLGINPSIFRYQVSNENDNHVFYAGSTPILSKELMRIHGSGNVGIGGTGIIPTNKLDVAAVTRTGSHPSNLPLYVTGNIGTNTNGMEIRKTDGTEGIGIGSTTVYATGAIQDLRMEAKGATGNVILSTNNTEKMRVTGDGKVGIGITNPGSTLEIARGTAEFGTMQINGTTYNSHINYGSPEDTYIRGGKEGAKVIINEFGELGNVGVGTANPLQKLHVGGSIAVDNKVGIGVTNPVEKLEVSGNAKVTGNVDVDGEVKMGYSVEYAYHEIGGNSGGNFSCICDPGYKVIGGGWGANGVLVITGSWADGDGSKWYISATNPVPFVPQILTVNAVCVRIGN